MTPLRLLATSFSLALVVTGAAAACSPTGSTGNTFPTSSGTGGSGGASGGTGGTGSSATGTGGDEDFFDAGLDPDGSGPDSGIPACAKETQFIYTLASDNMLYKFDPPTLVFTPIGKLDCATTGVSPFSMAVDRNAQAWVVFTNGTLAKVDTKTAHCTPTTFAPGQSGFTTFGMGFSSNSPGSADETLFVSDSSLNGGGSGLGLAKIDVNTLQLIPVGKYDKITARAEMTGTGDARLFAAFEGTPYNVAEVGKTDAKVLSQAPQSAINYAPGSSNFAFAFWGGDFWLFVGPGTKTDVFQYKPATGKTDQVQTTPAVIVGAGVSTCAPTKPPA